MRGFAEILEEASARNELSTLIRSLNVEETENLLKELKLRFVHKINKETNEQTH